MPSTMDELPAADEAAEFFYSSSPPREEPQPGGTGGGGPIISVWDICGVCHIVLTVRQVDTRDDDSAIGDLSRA